MAQEEPLTEQGYEREELGVNPYTAPSIARIFQQLADGFLVVEAERRNAVDDLGRVLMREARGLGVADRVMRHSASLTELGRRGDWLAVGKELIATQADVEQATIELRIKNGAFDRPGWLVARTGDQRETNRVGFFNATGKDPGTTGFGRLLHRRIEDLAAGGGPPLRFLKKFARA